MAVRALRGATQVDADERDAVIDATSELVRAVLDRNGLTDDALISITFTTTPDLTAEFPASAARTALGLDGVALLGAQEQAVPHGTPHCIRVLVHCYSDRSRDELRHVFLEGATALRTDLVDAD
jgi:chorismate mutase